GHRPRGRARVRTTAPSSRRGRANAARSITHVMTRIPARILLEIILMVSFGGIPRAGGFDRRRHFAMPFPRCIDASDDPFGRLALRVTLRKNCRAVLRADVVALAIERR